MNDFLTQLSNNRIRNSLTAVLVLLALFLLVSTIGTLKDMGRPSGPATDTITVSAEGQATAAPDVARISFTVQNSAPAVSDAQDKTTKQANTAIDYVKGQEIEEKDIKTLSYNISPQYSYYSCPAGTYCPPSNQKITGYEVSQTVQVTVRDLKTVGDLLAGLGKLEVQNISGPNFALDDTTAGYDAARADAIEKAKAQAKALSRQLGVRLGKIVNFSESSGGPYPMMYGMGASERSVDMKSVAPTIPTGQNTYNATVSITYEIR